MSWLTLKVKVYRSGSSPVRRTVEVAGFTQTGLVYFAFSSFLSPSKISMFIKPTLFVNIVNLINLCTLSTSVIFGFIRIKWSMTWSCVDGLALCSKSSLHQPEMLQSPGVPQGCVPGPLWFSTAKTGIWVNTSVLTPQQCDSWKWMMSRQNGEEAKTA